MTEHGYTGPATMAQLQAQLKELRTLLEDVLNALPKPAEESMAKLKVRLMEQIKNSLTGPRSIEAAYRAAADPGGIEGLGAKTFEAAMETLPHRPRPGRPTAQEAKAEAELAAQLQKMYRKRRLK